MRFLLEHVPVNPSIEYANGVVVPPGTTEIISRGGGSTIDVCKWVASRYNLKHTAIPTTAGTGSEVTPYIVLTVDGHKQTFTNGRYIPTSYILDPNLATTLPRLHTIASGLDALSQCLEASWSKNGTEESYAYASTGMLLVLKNLERCLDFPLDTQARMNMLIAANMSGRAITITKTNVCHAISYPLTDLYGIPHGIACAMSLVYFAQKMGHGNDMKKFIKKFLPKYKIDRKKVASIAIQSPKLQDYPLSITELDILKSLV